MHRTTDDSVRVAAIGFANCLVPFWQAELGPELLGLYLMGSLAHGGFSRRYSDIDIAVITEADYPHKRSIALAARQWRCQPIWGRGFPSSGPTGTLAAADFLRWIASITSIMRLR